MPIYVRKFRMIQKSEGGKILETPIKSQNISQIEGELIQFLREKGYAAQSKVGRETLTIQNITDMKTGKRAAASVYGRLRAIIAEGLQERNIAADVTGSY